MKPLALNLRDAKKVATDNHSSTFQLGSGHQIKVLHAPLPALQRKQIMQMPLHKYADGGDTQPDEFQDMMSAPGRAIQAFQGDPAAQQAAHEQAMASLPQTPEDETNNQVPAYQIPGNLTASLDKMGPTVGPVSDGSGAMNDNRPPQGAPQGQAPSQSPSDFQAAYDLGQKGISEQQDVQAKLAKQQAEVNQNNIDQKKQFAQDYQDSASQFQDQQQKFMADYMNNHIDPNHYVENMNAAQKATTAIGLVLGGFSSAFTGQGNPAMDFLNKQIERDISAQASRKDQQKTILGANQALFHDQTLAMNQTRMNMNDIYDHQMQQKALELGTPQAKAQADLAHAKFAMENQQLLQQNALRSAALKQLQGGGGNPAMLVPYLVPAEHQKDALKEIGQAKSAHDNHDFLMQQFDQANKENTVMRTGFGKVRTPPSIMAMNALELPMIHDQEGRVNEYEQHTLQELHPQPGDTDAKVAQKRRDYEQFIMNKTQTPTLDAYAPGLSNSLRPQQQSGPLQSREGEKGTLPNGQRFIVKNGHMVPIHG